MQGLLGGWHASRPAGGRAGGNAGRQHPTDSSPRPQACSSRSLLLSSQPPTRQLPCAPKLHQKSQSRGGSSSGFTCTTLTLLLKLGMVAGMAKRRGV